MQLSRKSIEVLLDLVELKISCIQVLDREDARELALMEQAKQELTGAGKLAAVGDVVPFPGAKRRRGRPRKTAAAVG